MLSEETRHSSETDALSLILSRFGADADMFFSGTLCGRSSFDDPHGHLHLVRRGPATLIAANSPPVEVIEPSLVLYPRPQPHEIVADDAAGAELLCARLSFGGGAANPLLLGFPPRFVISLDRLSGLEQAITLLFAEASAADLGNRTTINLLMRVLLALLFRFCIQEGMMETGLLAGLSDPRLARALKAMHETPARPWNIETLADEAGMSRASFAALFRQRIGQPPAEYLTTMRLAMTKQELRAGRSLKAVARAVGYASPTALSRVFARRFGCTPRHWLEQQAERAG